MRRGKLLQIAGNGENAVVLLTVSAFDPAVFFENRHDRLELSLLGSEFQSRKQFVHGELKRIAFLFERHFTKRVIHLPDQLFGRIVHVKHEFLNETVAVREKEHAVGGLAVPSARPAS